MCSVIVDACDGNDAEVSARREQIYYALKVRGNNFKINFILRVLRACEKFTDTVHTFELLIYSFKRFNLLQI